MRLFPSVTAPFVFRFGPHLLRSEASNFFHIVLDGDVTGEQVSTLFSSEPPGLDPDAPVVLLLDVRKLGTIRPTALHGQKPKPQKEMSFVAYVGATFTMRVVTNMFNNAMQILARRRFIVHEYFEDEATARQWLEERVQKHAAEKNAEGRLTTPPPSLSPKASR